MQQIDPHIAMHLLREHRREIAGVRKPGRMPSVASNAEVAEALTKKLKIFGERVRVRKRQAGREGPDRHGADAPRDDG